MTVSSSLSGQTFDCDGSTTVFTCPFRVLEASELVGYLITVATNESVALVNGTDFAVTGVGTANAIATTTLTYSSAYQVNFRRRTARLQSTDYRDNDPFPAESHESALDRLTHIAQEADADVARALLVPEPETGITLPTAADRAGLLLGFDDDGGPIAVAPVSGSAADLALQLLGTGTSEGAAMIGFKAAGTGAVARTAQAKMRERISVSDFLSAAELAAVQAGASAMDVSVAVRRAVVAGAGRDVYFDAPGTYYMATADSGAYITLSATGTRLRLEKNAKIRFADAAVYGINITGQLCGVEGGLLWGTNTTAPTITAMVRVAGNNSDVIGCNIAYAVIGTDIAGTYIIKHERNSYSNCDTFLKTSGSCADLESKGNTYGTSSIGTAANVIVSGSGGIDMHDYWESMDQAKLALQCVTGAQRVAVRGKFFDSGGIEVQNSVYLRLDAEVMDSYTGTVAVDVKSGGTVDATGSFFSGPGITSGVEAFNVDGNLAMGSGFVTKWQIGGDINGNASVGDVILAQCTTGWDVAGSALGKIGPCFYSGVTTPIVRASGTILSMLDAFTGSATFDPISLADGAGETTTITVTGARLGDTCEVSFSNDLQGIIMTSWVTNDTVNVRFQNETGGTIDLASGTLRARVSTKVI